MCPICLYLSIVAVLSVYYAYIVANPYVWIVAILIAIGIIYKIIIKRYK